MSVLGSACGNIHGWWRAEWESQAHRVEGLDAEAVAAPAAQAADLHQQQRALVHPLKLAAIPAHPPLARITSGSNSRAPGRLPAPLF